MSSSASDEHLYRRLHALVLGGSDMYDVLQTAQYLLGQHAEAPGHDGSLPWHVRRTLETGLFVTYARPFVEGRGRGLPQLKRARGLSAELQASHADILERRNTVYAHTDETPLRRILELSNAAERAAGYVSSESSRKSGSRRHARGSKTWSRSRRHTLRPSSARSTR